MSGRTNQYVLYCAKLEAADGQDATPSATADVIELAQPFEPDDDLAYRTARPNAVAGHANATKPLLPKGKVTSWTKSMTWRSLGEPTASNPPELHPLFVAAGMAATFGVVGGRSQVIYTPASNTFRAPGTSLTEYYYEDGILHKAVGARAELGLSFDVGGPVMIEAATMGVALGSTDTPFPPSITYRPGLEPPTATDLTVCSVDGYATGAIRKWGVKLGNSIVRRGDLRAPGGVRGYRIASRVSTWECTLEEPLLAEKDFRALRDSNADVALSWAVGGSTQDLVRFDTAKAVIENVKASNDGGLKLITISGGLYGATPFALTIR